MNKKAYVYKMNLGPANVLSILILILMWILTAILGVAVYPSNINTFILFTTTILYFMFHEVLHGIGFILGGANRKNVTYGIELEKGILYCMANQELTKKNILISLQMPFMVIGVITYIIGIILNLPLLTLLSSMNISGASMDLMMFIYISRIKNVTYSESGKSNEFVLISEEDLSKRKSIFLRVVDTKKYNKKDYEFTGLKKFRITKTSIIILVLFLLLGLISTII